MSDAAAKDKAPPDAKRGSSRPPRPAQWSGYIPVGSSSAILVGVVIPAILTLLVALSVLGTFYGVQSMDVPFLNPGLILADLSAAPGLVFVALITQGVLTFAQYGASELAQVDSRWWIVYLLSLGASVGLNWIGYGNGLLEIGMPWLLAFGVVVASDVVPELAMKKRG